MSTSATPGSSPGPPDPAEGTAEDTAGVPAAGTADPADGARRDTVLAAEGRSLGPLAKIVIGLVSVLAACGFAVIYVFAGNSNPGIVSQTVSFHIQSDTSVQIRYAVAKDADDVVECTVDAFDTRFNILATTRITVPAGVEKIDGARTLRTGERATGARIKDCHTV
jgi:hypothetical protein